MRNYFEQLHAKKLDNLGKMDKFLETYNLPKLNQEATESLNRPITTSEIEAVIKKVLAYKKPGPDGFTGVLANIQELTPNLFKLLQKIK